MEVYPLAYVANGRKHKRNPETGRWYTVGDHGAEFAPIPKGAIVFNHKQTEQLLKYGHINSRGKALAGGNAYSESSIKGTWVVGSGSTPKDDKPAKDVVNTVKDTAKTVTNTVTQTTTKAADDIADATKTSEDALQAFQDANSKLYDWVERAIENIDKRTEKYLTKAEKKIDAGNYSGAAKQYQKALNQYDKAIGTQGNAENLYMTQANKVLQSAISKGLISQNKASSIQNRVANGSIDLSSLSEGTKAVVEAYKDYYDKAQAAADATIDLYDKYEETAQKMYQLPLDKASDKTDKLKNSYDILEKKLDLTTNTSKQASIIEQQINNIRKQHTATMKAEAAAEQNLAKARAKVNQESDKALKGLSDEDKQKVTAKVKDELQIDVTALVGLTAEGKQAILDYNAALAAQKAAMQELQISALETTASLRELAAAQANKPIEKAENKIASLSAKDEIYQAQMEAASDATSKNGYLTKLSNNATKKSDAAWDALESTETAMYQAATKNVVAEILDEQGRNVGQKVNIARSGYKEGTEEYEALVKYNASVDAYRTASDNYDKWLANEETTRRNNAMQSIANIAADWDYSIAKQTNKRDNIQAGLDALGTTLNQIAANPEMAQILAQDFADRYGWQIDPTKSYYENQQIGFNALADANTTLSSWFDEKANDMADQYELVKGDIIDSAQVEDDILAVRKEGYEAEKAASDAIKQATEAATNASPEQTEKRELERKYNEHQEANTEKKAAGQYLTNDDYKQTLDYLKGWVDEAGEVHQGLLSMQEAEVEALTAYRDSLVEGTQEWIDADNAVTEAKSALSELSDAAREAADGITQNDEKAFEDALGLNAHNGNMIDAKNRKADAIGQAIGSVFGGDVGEAVSAVIQTIGGIGMVGLGMAGAFSTAINDPNGFSLQGLFSAVTGNMSDVYTTQTKMGNLQEAHGIYDNEMAYYQERLSDQNLSDEDRDYFQQKYWEAEEARANNEADQEEEKNKNKGGGGGGGGGGNAAQQAWQMVDDQMRWYYNQQLHILRVIEGHIKDINRNMQRAELEGRDVDSNDYVQLAKEQKDWNHQLQEKVIPAAKTLYYHQLSNQDDKTGEALESAWNQWKQHQDELKDGELEILKIIRQGLRDSVFAPLEHIHDLQTYAMDAIDSISGLITDQMRYTKDNQLSQWGQYQNDMYVGQFRNAQEQIQSYIQDIQAINAEASAGLYTGDEAREKIAEAQQEIIRLMGDEESAAQGLADTLKGLGEKELDSLHDIIDARKEALRAKQDYYEYDKNIRSQTKDIQALQAQIAALDGLTDAESKAKRARLEADLAEAQEKLDDTVKEHEMTLASDALDDLAKTLDEAFEDEWDEVTSDLHNLLAYAEEIAAKRDGEQISDSMNAVLKEFGIEFDELGRDLSQFGIITRNAVIETTDGRVDSAMFETAMDKLIDHLKTLQTEGLISAELNVESLRDPYENAVSAGERVENRDTDNNIDTSTKPQTYKEAWKNTVYSEYDRGLKMKDDLSGWEKWQNTLGAFSDAQLKPGVHLLMTNFMTELAFAVPDAFFDLIGAFIPSVSKWWDKTLYGGLLDSLQNGWLSKMRKTNSDMPNAVPAGDTDPPKQTFLSGLFNSFKKHKSGARRISAKQLAWTQENGKEEWIVRPSDGAILTPLAEGDGVLPADITSKLWSLAEGNLPQMQRPTFQMPDYDIDTTFAPTVNIDNSITVEGSVDAAVISDLEKFKNDQRDELYHYISDKMFRGYQHAGGKRRI